MHRRSHRRFTRPWIAVAVLLTVGVSAGCGESEPSPPVAQPPQADANETAAHKGKVCPDRLPQSDDSDHGFGTGEPAESEPSLPTPESAWVCQYNATEAGPGPEGQGTTVGWVRAGDADTVDPTRLQELERDLAELRPAERNRACTADLGPRWMLVYSSGNDLTGVVVDDFGCRDVRLTDEPFETVPGDSTQPGIVPGVLSTPGSLLAHLKAAHG
jgi:hypothetical protein